MSNRLTTSIAAICCVILIVLALFGCGGGNSGNNSSTLTKTGQVQLHIIWPAKSTVTGRYIPQYASSLFFELSPKGNPAQIYTLIVNRPSSSASTQDVMFSQLLSAGTYELAGAARSLADAQGATVASGAVEVNVQPGINPVPLTLNSTVRTLLILGQPLAFGVGQSPALQSGAFDPDGNGLLLPDGALTWSVVSGSQFGSITAGGKLTATSAGTIRVRVAEPVTGVKADADVIISLQSSSSGLAKSGYPRAGADNGGSSLVQGSGAVGQLAWNFDLGDRGVDTPVLGNNNLIFALQASGIVYALDATTGGKQWQATLPNVGGRFSDGSLVAGDDNTVYVGYPYGVQAYDAATALPKWTNTDFVLTGRMNLVNGKLYVPSMNQGIGVIDARTGTTLTKYPGLVFSYDIAIGNGIGYYVTIRPGAMLYAVNLATGSTVWSKNVSSPLGGHEYDGNFPVIGPDGTVYMATGDGKFVAFDAQTGAQKGSLGVGDYFGGTQAAFGMDGSVYFVKVNSDFTSMIAHYSASLTQSLGSSPLLLRQMSVGPDGTIYGGALDKDNSDQATVYALNASDGSVKWKVPLTAAGFNGNIGVAYSAVAKSGMVYMVSIDHRLYAIK